MKNLIITFLIVSSLFSTQGQPVPSKATQAQVNGGTNNTQFVTPLTLANKTGGSLTNGGTFSGTFVGNGAGITNIYATNVIGVGFVNNIKNFGATGTSNWVTDTAAFNTALLYASTNGWPIYIPAGSYGCSNWTINPAANANLNSSANGVYTSSIRIIGDTLATKLYQAFTNVPSMCVISNMNNLRLEYLNFLGLGQKNQATNMVYFNGVVGSLDDLVVSHCQFQNSWIPFTLSAVSDSSFMFCNITKNHYSGMTLKAPGESNNNDEFFKGSMLANDQGFLHNDGTLKFWGVEMGAISQTNCIVCTNDNTQVTMNFDGGNVEIDYGSLVVVSNTAIANITLNGTRVVAANNNQNYLADFQNTDGIGSYFKIIDGMQAGLNIRSSGRFGRTCINESTTPTGIKFEVPGYYTNYVGKFAEYPSIGQLAADTDKNFNNIVYLRGVNSSDSLGRDQHYLGVSTAGWPGVAAGWTNIVLEQPTYDKNDGKIANPIAVNNWSLLGTVLTNITTAVNGFGYGWRIDARLGSGGGRQFSFTSGQETYTQFGFASSSANGGAIDHWNWMFETLNNKLYVGGDLIVSNQFTISANSIATFATNRLVFTTVSSLTNTLGRDATAIISAGTSVILQDTNGGNIATLGTVATLDVLVPMSVNMRLSGTGVSAILY